jgi:hypothetical protein
MISNNPNYTKKALTLIAAFALLRLIISFAGQLGNDESYYWLYSQHIKSNYFDHPPMIALWIRASTLNLWLQDFPGFIRLASVCSGAIASWFMYRCVALISTERAGIIAVCLYNASFYAGAIAGIYAFPDAPQMVFWTASLWCVAAIFRNEKNRVNWLLFGICTGLCIMSKVHGIFLWIGMGCYILFYKRSWLTNPYLYAALLISLIICSPILLWNIHYNFLTWRFNEARINTTNEHLNWADFFNEAWGQLSMNNAVNVIITVIALANWKKKSLQQYDALKLFNCAGLLHAGILLAISLHRQTLSHWSGPAYVTLIPAASIYLDTINITVANRIARLSMTLYVLVIVISLWFTYFFPGNIGAHSKRFMGFGDKSLDLYGWKNAGEKFDSIYDVQIANHSIASNTPMVCNSWWGAHIEYYYCRPLDIQMIGLGDIMNLHEYAWMNALRKDSVNMQKAFCIVPSYGPYNPRTAYKDYYNIIDSITTIPVMRGDKPAANFYVYKLSGWKGTVPLEK